MPPFDAGSKNLSYCPFLCVVCILFHTYVKQLVLLGRAAGGEERGVGEERKAN